MVSQAMIRWFMIFIPFYHKLSSEKKTSSTILVLSRSLKCMALASCSFSWLRGSCCICSGNFSRCSLVCVHKDSVLTWTLLLSWHVRKNLICLDFGLEACWRQFFVFFTSLMIPDPLLNSFWIFLLNVDLQIFASQTDMLTNSSFLRGNNSLNVRCNLIWIGLSMLVVKPSLVMRWTFRLTNVVMFIGSYLVVMTHIQGYSVLKGSTMSSLVVSQTMSMANNFFCLNSMIWGSMRDLIWSRFFLISMRYNTTVSINLYMSVMTTLNGFRPLLTI